MKRKILIVTERRADFSKFRPILQAISRSKKLKYCLIVTGSHLLQEHGYTINEIKNDGFQVSYTFSMYGKKKGDTGADMVRAFGRSISELSYMIEKEKPDIILAGFDIGANFAAAIIGAHMNILVAHIEGGEVTGTIDESIRHATSKFSHIHFTSNIEATKRLVKMGENPEYIFTVGNPALDSISQAEKIPVKILEKKYDIDFNTPFVIILQHTVTSEIDKIDKHIIKTIEAVKELDVQSLIIHGNADAGSNKISKIIKNSKITHHMTVPFTDYVNLLRHASALVGNSSSGIIETPFLHIPSVNIGTRQEGRLKSISVINVAYDKEQIKKAIKKALYDKNFHKQIARKNSLYGNGNASIKIIKILENINLKRIPIQKKLSY